MKHYRVNKLASPEGDIVKRKDVLANDDKQALADAAADDDCPICDVWHAGKKVGSINRPGSSDGVEDRHPVARPPRGSARRPGGPRTFPRLTGRSRQI
jgi:hypothetical protein